MRGVLSFLGYLSACVGAWVFACVAWDALHHMGQPIGVVVYTPGMFLYCGALAVGLFCAAMILVFTDETEQK